MIELYYNPAAEILDYANQEPLMVHLAFVSENPEEEKERLQKAGAVLVSDDTLDDGTRLLMMRDPWGQPFNFAKGQIQC